MPQTILPSSPSKTTTILRASGLHKSFVMGDSTVTVLKGADLDVKDGEFVAIEGRSGSGKSTFLHLLAGLDSADAGSIAFDGQEIGGLAQRAARWNDWLNSRWLMFPGSSSLVDLVRLALNVSDRRLARIRNRSFGFVFQFYHLLPELNVLENVLLAPMVEHSFFGFAHHRGQLLERAHTILKDFGLDHRLKHRPSHLSGGERQRVAIARALMNNPQVLFADEPTGNLDIETGQQIMAVLEKLHRQENQTIIMVTHDRTLARQADRVFVLKDGKLEKAE